MENLGFELASMALYSSRGTWVTKTRTQVEDFDLGRFLVEGIASVDAMPAVVAAAPAISRSCAWLGEGWALRRSLALFLSGRHGPTEWHC